MWRRMEAGDKETPFMDKVVVDPLSCEHQKSPA